MYGDNVAYNGCFRRCRRHYGGIDMYGVYESKLKRVPIHRCSCCNAPLYENEEIYEVELDSENVEYLCENCIDDYIDDRQFEVNEWFKAYNKVIL